MNRKDRRAMQSRAARAPRAPEFAALVDLGGLLLRQGKLAQAREALERAALLAPDHAAAHAGLGDLALREADAAAAIDAYLRAIEREPARLAAHYGLCSALLLQGRFAEAIAHLGAVLEHKPDYVDGLCLLANAHLGAGAPQAALAAARKAFALADTAPVRSLLANCLRTAPSVPDDPALRAILMRAMSEPWDRPMHLAGHAITLISADLAPLLDRGATDDVPLAPLCANPLLRCLLESTLAADAALERLLTAARATLLRAADAAWSEDQLAFCCALACQCFVNEYVYALSAVESAHADRLQDELAGGEIAPHRLALLACYRPLHALSGADRLLARRWPAPVEALLTRQVREPAEEARLAPDIARLTPIEDGISLRVQQQYEQNPYPRWVKAPPASRPASIDQFIGLNFPHTDLPYRKLGHRDPLDVLVAGCGTGQQLFDLAQRLANPRILAIDLSRASLAYAGRKVEEAGLRNIELGQADILRLGTLGRSFDVIDCGGVLHHLGDPLAGWRVLRSLLRPDGLMHIALYSEIARRSIVAAQQRAAAQGFGDTPDGIRRFRQLLIAEPPGGRDSAVRNGDFYSLSTCRDLLFHVQEHRFTLPQIAAFLNESGLRLIGMDAPARLRRAYAARFTADTTLTDLANWDAFEQDNPAAFIGMYQFWVQAG